MNKQIALLIALSTSAACMCMEKEEKKEIITSLINHQNTVSGITFSPNRYITFSVDKVGAEIYDSEKKEIIKTVSNLAWWPGGPDQLHPSEIALMTFERKRETSYFCSLYNLQQNFEKMFLKASIAGQEPYLRNYFILAGKKLLTPLQERTGYRTYDIKSTVTQTTNFDTEIWRYMLSPNTQILSVLLKNKQLFCSNLLNNSIEEVVSQATVARFSPDSSILACFDVKNSVITLYDTYNARVIKQQRVKEEIKDLFFPTKNLVFFSSDKQKYTIWDIEEETFTALELPSRKYEPEIELPLKHFIHFETYPDHTIYNIAEKKLTILKENGHGAYLTFNLDERYAAYTTNGNLAVLYETKNWNVLTRITFENGRFNPFAFFSLCGQFLAVPSIGAKWIKLYDINNDKILFESPWEPSHPRVEFHPKGLLIFRANEKLVIVYDYINNKFSKIDTKEKIGAYSVHDDTLAVSSGTTTQLFALDELEYSNYIKEEVTELNVSENKELTVHDEVAQQYPDLCFYTNNLAACHDDTKTVVIYDFEHKKLATVQRGYDITHFKLQEHGITLFGESESEYVAMNNITFKEIKKEESKGCVIA